MTPETGAFLRDYDPATATAFLDQVDRWWPCWYLANMTGELGGDASSGMVQPINSYALFMARAWIMQDKPDELRKRLDISWTERGDWFFIHKLAETIKAYRTAL